jgi:hypothetical protein
MAILKQFTQNYCFVQNNSQFHFPPGDLLVKQSARYIDCQQKIFFFNLLNTKPVIIKII